MTVVPLDFTSILQPVKVMLKCGNTLFQVPRAAGKRWERDSRVVEGLPELQGKNGRETAGWLRGSQSCREKERERQQGG